jgi:prephenate dehydratase
VNLSRIESRPTGQYLGHYFFSIDADGHVADARVADALAGLHRISPATRFLGSYGRADEQSPVVASHTSDEAFRAAHAWVGQILASENVDSGMARDMAKNASPTA